MNNIPVIQQINSPNFKRFDLTDQLFRNNQLRSD